MWKRKPWWQWGLSGALLLSLATLVKAICALPRLFREKVSWDEFPEFAAFLFGTGFAIGVLVWALRFVTRPFGRCINALTGIFAAYGFFAICFAAFGGYDDPFAVLYMFCLATFAGAYLGWSIGKDLADDPLEPKERLQ